ncbi:hypothetical protein ACWGE0_31495 [Lentzea sp. NPDC054927]
MRAVVRSVALVALLVGLLAGCNSVVQYYEDVDDLGKKIVADWKELPEVTDARYDYQHGIDSGQQMNFEVVIRTEAVSDEIIDKLKDIGSRDYWQSTAYDRGSMPLRFAAYSSDNPPPTKSGPDTAIHRAGLGVSKEVGLEKYGPRPTTR